MNDYAVEIIYNSILALVAAQVIKFIIFSIKEKKMISKALISTGGMPSSHSSLVSALTMSIYLYHGVNVYFAIALVLSLVIIHDAMGIRYEASKHARALNQIKLRLNLIENIDVEEKKLKEALGHKPREVLAGVILGVAVAIIGFYILK